MAPTPPPPSPPPAISEGASAGSRAGTSTSSSSHVEGPRRRHDATRVLPITRYSTSSLCLSLDCPEGLTRRSRSSPAAALHLGHGEQPSVGHHALGREQGVVRAGCRSPASHGRGHARGCDQLARRRRLGRRDVAGAGGRGRRSRRGKRAHYMSETPGDRLLVGRARRRAPSLPPSHARTSRASLLLQGEHGLFVLFGFFELPPPLGSAFRSSARRLAPAMLRPCPPRVPRPPRVRPAGARPDVRERYRAAVVDARHAHLFCFSHVRTLAGRRDRELFPLVDPFDLRGLGRASSAGRVRAVRADALLPDIRHRSASRRSGGARRAVPATSHAVKNRTRAPSKHRPLDAAGEPRRRVQSIATNDAGPREPRTQGARLRTYLPRCAGH